MHRRGFNLDLAVLCIHTINTFGTEKYSRILTLNIYLNVTFECDVHMIVILWMIVRNIKSLLGETRNISIWPIL